MQFSFNDLKLRGYAGIIGINDRSIRLSIDSQARCKILGHTAAIRTITVNEPRKLFASGARDRTVKIWSLNVHDGIENWESNPYSECLVTYNGHRRGAITDVHFLIGIGGGLSDVMASCDGTVHVSIETLKEPFVSIALTGILYSVAVGSGNRQRHTSVRYWTPIHGYG